jgi:hypothetical protein
MFRPYRVASPKLTLQTLPRDFSDGLRRENSPKFGLLRDEATYLWDENRHKDEIKSWIRP